MRNLWSPDRANRVGAGLPDSVKAGIEATRTGVFRLSVNDNAGKFNDNAGEFNVEVDLTDPR